MKKSTITCDMEGRILTMNDGAVQIFGYSKEVGLGVARILGEDMNPLKRPLKKDRNP